MRVFVIVNGAVVIERKLEGWSWSLSDLREAWRGSAREVVLPRYDRSMDTQSQHMLHLLACCSTTMLISIIHSHIHATSSARLGVSID